MTVVPAVHGSPQRYAEGCHCEECSDAHQLRRSMLAKRLPVGPALDAITATGITISSYHQTAGINIYRAIRAGEVTVVTGDRIAASLGMHPVEIWEDWGRDDPVVT